MLHYNNRKLRPLAKTCCITGGVIVYTKGRVRGSRDERIQRKMELTVKSLEN